MRLAALIAGITVVLLALPLAAGAVTPLGSPASTGTFAMEASVGAGMTSGDTSYRIGGAYTGSVGGVPVGGTVRFPVSKLEFPVDVPTATARASVGYGRLLARLSITTNLDDHAGTAEDSDWGVHWLDGVAGTSPHSLDVFSESDATLDAFWFRLDALYRLVDRPLFTLAVGPSFRSQKFDYEVRDLDQWYPSSRGYFGHDWGHDLVPGRIGTYEVTYRIPAALAAAELRTAAGLTIGAELGLGYVTAEDRDDHILRSKLNQGDGTGTAVMLGAGLRYGWRSGFFAGLSFDYLEIRTEGTQRQVFYRTTEEAVAGDWFEVDQRITSSQLSLDLTVGYRF